MYSVPLVNKEMFSLIVPYLGGLEGECKKRVLLEANKRALRFKSYEKMINYLKEKDENEKYQLEVHGRTIGNENTLFKPLELINTKDSNPVWEKLSHHNKRKEYKRARKVIITLNDSSKGIIENKVP